MDNLYIYNRARSVPEEAKKQITAGRLKGMTDINPLFRIKTLTELLAPAESDGRMKLINSGSNPTARK